MQRPVAHWYASVHLQPTARLLGKLQLLGEGHRSLAPHSWVEFAQQPLAQSALSSVGGDTPGVRQPHPFGRFWGAEQIAVHYINKSIYIY